MRRLCELCAAMGGCYLVRGSPKQYLIAEGQSREAASAPAAEAFSTAGTAARAASVTYCIELPSADQNPLINTVTEAAAIVRAVDNPHPHAMIDTSSAGLAEAEAEPFDYVPDGAGLRDTGGRQLAQAGKSGSDVTF
jgi:sugar phosphate isomerase/epimerase